MKRCAYEILGVSRDATESALKKAYKKLALKWHPDRHVNGDEKQQADAEEKFKEVASAYEVLTDSDKRAAYDAGGWAALEGGVPLSGQSPFAPDGHFTSGGHVSFPGTQHFVFSSNGNGNSFRGNVDPFELFASMFGDGIGIPAAFGEAGMGRSSHEAIFGPRNRKKRGRKEVGLIAPGTKVVAHSLTTTGLNGEVGVIDINRTTNGRYSVNFPKLGKYLSLKRENILQLGVRVRLRGLTSQPQLNGIDGELVGIKGDRYIVRAPGSGRPLSFRRECVQLPIGTAVVVSGLATRPELNGLAAETTGELDPTSGRYIVQLETGQQLKLKAENLMC